MHFHYYTLKALNEHFREKLHGKRIWNCFSQNKNELIIEWEEGFIRVGCHTPLTYLIPVDEFARARKNVVNLFPQISGKKVLSSKVVPNERILILELDGNNELIFKMHGTGANVLLRQAGEIKELFIQQKDKDKALTIEAGPFNPKAAEEVVSSSPEHIMNVLKAISPMYDKRFATRTLDHMKQGDPFRLAFEKVEKEACSGDYYIYREGSRMRFMLFEIEGNHDFVRVNGIIPALQLFFRLHFQYETYQKQYSETLKALKKPFQKFEKVYQSYLRSIRQLETDRDPEELGHILMANLHQIQTGEQQVELDDYYRGAKVQIRLDPRLNPQENAERYYKKHKQRKGKLGHLKTQLLELEKKKIKAGQELEAFLQLPEPGDLTLSDQGFEQEELRALKQFGREVRKQQDELTEKQSPFRTFSKDSYEIFVGRNGRNNDELSFKFASKDDLWLHAKDVTGSHVIIRQKPGSEIPIHVLEYAAQLAAFYSKRKNDTLVPVIYTPRKFIRKRKGDPPGQVVVERESVIMVEPVRE